MNATEIAVIIGASVQAASTILGLGVIRGQIGDIREDMRYMRESVQNCLQPLLIRNGRPPAETLFPTPGAGPDHPPTIPKPSKN